MNDDALPLIELRAWRQFLTLAETLELPLRERNVLLVAAGFAPVSVYVSDDYVRAVRGQVQWEGSDVTNRAPERAARLGGMPVHAQPFGADPDGIVVLASK